MMPTKPRGPRVTYPGPGQRKLTINLPVQLLIDSKVKAVREGRFLKEVIVEALEAYVRKGAG